ncbi:MAG: hypothetical protein KTR33_13685, partial [Gammaproteobacteria bacterium]|nr:hypothetical protein [Gammaproteobacteria bacterium]
MPDNLSGATPMVSPSSTTTYTLTATDEYGCSSTDEVTVTVNELPVVNLTKVDASCGQANGSITASVSGGSSPYTYVWSGGVSTSDQATDLAPGSYSVTVTDANNCTSSASISINTQDGPQVMAMADETICEGTTVNLTATVSGGTGSVTTVWTPGDLTGTSVSVTPAVTTTYTVTSTDENGCIATDEVTITVDPAIVSGISAPQSRCAQEGILFAADPAVAGATYAWSFSGPATPSSSTSESVVVSWADEPGVYMAMLTISRGTCVETYTHEITITEAVFANAGPDLTICQGGSVLLGLPEGEGGPMGATYTWEPNLFLDNANIAQPLASPPFNMTYTLTVEASGCVRTDQVRVNVDVNYNPVADAGTDESVCAGTEVTLGGNPTGTPPPANGGATITDYTWSPAAGLSDPTAANPTVTINSTQTYEVIITAAGGCTDTASVTYTVISCGSIGDFVWNDLDEDGIQDAGESGIGGVTVNLLNSAGDVIATTSTEADGSYLFTDLLAEDYQLEFVAPAGYTFSPEGAGSDPALDSDANVGTGLTEVFSLSSGETLTDLDAGFYNTMSVVVATTDVDCAGNSTGSIDLTVNAGLAPYTFAWADGPTTEDRSDLAAGTYTVTVTDATNNTVILSPVINEPVALVLSASQVDILCHGASTGSIDLTVSGGTAPYTYAWTGGATSEDLSGLSAGSYEVTVTDANGCTETLSRTLSEPTDLVASTTPTASTCGSANGELDLTVNGGTAPYTYAWSDNASTEDRTGLLAGSYTVTITDDNGCITTASATISDEDGPAVSASITDNDICVGQSTTLNASATGGSGNISYSWDNGAGTGASVSVSPAATTTYTVTATDTNGCTSTAQVTVTVNDLPIVSFSGDTEICVGESTTLTASGGDNYAWSTSDNTASITVTPGNTSTYTVTVTDGNGCSQTGSVTVTVNPNPTAVIEGDPLVCENASTTLTASGAGANGSYVWSTNETTASITVMPTTPTTYTVTVTDENGCTDEASITTNSAPSPEVVTASAELCVGESTTLTASGGTSYQWDSQAGDATTASVDVTPATTTTYQVTVTNAVGCEAVGSITITVLDLPVISNVATQDPIDCDGSNTGQITVTASGSGGTLQYRINAGPWQSSNVFTDLAAGTYNVEVSYTGARCMVGPQTVTLNDATPPVAEAGTDVAICVGESTTLNGSATGGTGSITYTWMPGSLSGSTPTVSPSSTTTYTLTATDEYGCSSTDEVTVTVNELPVVNLTKVDASCGVANGSITASVSGGASPYSYVWSGGASTSDQATDLAPDTYSVTVTDANNCTASASISINTQDGPEVTAIDDETICEGATVNLTATVSGGTGSVSTVWTPGDLTGTSVSVTPAVTTTYTVTSTDENGCIATDEVTITVDPAIVSGISAPQARCAQEGVLFAADPAVAGATYAWSFSGPATPSTSTNESVVVSWADEPGTYTAMLTISRGTCVETYTHEITITEAVFANAGPDLTICQGGSVLLGLPEGEGGPMGATYTWEPNLFLDNPNIAQPLASPPFDMTYTLTVEASGCVRTDQVRVNVDVNYNPIADAGADESVCAGTEVTLGGSPTGTPPPANPGATITDYAWSPSTGLSDPTAANPTVTINSTQTYQVIITAAGGCTDTASVTYTVISCGSIGDFVWNDLDEDGIQDAGESGIAGVTVNLLNSAGDVIATTTTEADGSYLFTDLFASDYQLEFVAPAGYTFSPEGAGSDPALDSDANVGTGLTEVFSLSTGETLTDLDAGFYNTMSVVVATTDVDCAGNSTGSIDLTVNAGLAPYTFAWADGPSTEDRTDLAAGTYTVTVTDATNNTVVLSPVVNEPVALVLSATQVDILCHGASTGSIDLTVSGGTAPYNYAWTGGATSEDISGLSAGSYEVTVTDANGCTETLSRTLSEPSDLVASATPTASTCGSANGEIDLTVSGGTAPYTYVWSDNASTEDRTGL